MSTFDPIERKRMRWRSRRGLLELDLILERFLANHFDALSDQQLEAYRRVLQLADNDFLDVVTGRAHLDDAEEMAIIQMLRNNG